MNDYTQSSVRKNPAPSSRQHGLRSLPLLNPRKGSFLEFTNAFDDRSSEKPKHSVAQTFDLPLTDEKQETTAEAALDADSIRLLRSMFLLLDEWDRQLRVGKIEQSSEECEIAIDTTTQ